MPEHNSKHHGFDLSGNAAELYQRVLVPAWLEQWAEALVEFAQVRPGWSVLDAACGTGVVARLAAKAIGSEGQVYGIDVNEPMLEVARSLSRISAPSIRWLNRDVADTKLENNSVNRVLSQQGLQYFPDKVSALKEMHRILTPGGRAVLSVWKEHSVYTSTLVKALDLYLSSEAATQQDASRKTPQAEELLELMFNAGFSDVVVESQALEIHTPKATKFVPRHLSAMPVGVAYNALDTSTRETLASYVESELRNYTHGSELVYMDIVNIVTGVK